jgi:quinol monooxygenase YgiN
MYGKAFGAKAGGKIHEIFGGRRGVSMITTMLHIRVRPGYEEEAVDTLSAIERHARQDTGMVNFTWLRDEHDLGSFTLFEQWESQEDHDRHLSAGSSRWERFVPCLAEEPRPGSFRPVSELAAAPGPDEVSRLVRDWFGKLSAHAPVREVLPMLVTDGLIIELPEGTLTTDDEFRKWYTRIGNAYYGQSYELEYLEATEVPGSLAADLDLTVVWRVRRAGDGASLAFRTHQSWRLVRCPKTGRALIARLQVREVTENPVPAASHGAVAR